MTGEIKEGSLVRLKSGNEGWIKGQVVEYTDLITFPALGGAIYTGPGYKVYILEGKHKGETIRMPANYVEPVGAEGVPVKGKREPLFPHVPKKKEPIYPHRPRGKLEELPQTKEARTAYYAQAWVGETLESSTPDYEVTRLTLEEARRDMERWKQKPNVLAIEIYRGKQEFIEDPEAGRDGGYWQLAQHEDWEFVEYWQRPGTIERLASTEGNPIRKFCCRVCGECAPKELLEEGRLLDRISWLRQHYKEKHPGMWGKMSPMTIEDGELVSPEYRHLAGLVSEPLPKDAD